MAHGLESRVPLLDHRLVELAATIPADSKFRDGQDEARLQGDALVHWSPRSIARAQGQDGLPGAAERLDGRAGARILHRRVLERGGAAARRTSTTAGCWPSSTREPRFGRKVWGLLSLELWQRAFHDREHEFKRLLTQERTATTHEGSDHRRRRLHRLAPRRPAARRGPRGARHRQLRHRPARQPGRARRPDDRRGHDRRRRRRRRARSSSSARRTSSTPRPPTRTPRPGARTSRTNALGTANVVKATQAAGLDRLDLLPDRALLRHPARGAADHARPPGPPGLVSYAISQDRRRAVHRARRCSNYVSFRLANAYGPRNISGPLPTFFQRLTAGKPCFVMDTRRDFIFVDDLIDVVMLALAGTGQRQVPRVVRLGLLDQGAVRRHDQGARHRARRGGRGPSARRGRRLHDPARPVAHARGLRGLARAARRSRRASPGQSSTTASAASTQTFTHLKVPAQ